MRSYNINKVKISLLFIILFFISPRISFPLAVRSCFYEPIPFNIQSLLLEKKKDEVLAQEINKLMQSIKSGTVMLDNSFNIIDFFVDSEEPLEKDIKGKIIGRRFFDILPYNISEERIKQYLEVFNTRRQVNIKDVEINNGMNSKIFNINIFEMNGNLFINLIDITPEKVNRHKFNKFLSIQNKLNSGLRGAFNINESLEMILDSAFELDDIDCGGVYIKNEITDALELLHSRGFSSEGFISSIAYYPKDTKQAQLVEQGETIFNFDLRTNLDLVSAEILQKEGLKSICMIPVKWNNKVIACVNLASHKYNNIDLLTREGIVNIFSCLGSVFSRLTEEKEMQKNKILYNSYKKHMQNGFAYHKIVVDDNNNPIDYIFLDINNEFEKQTGLKRENVIGRKVSEVLPEINKDETDWIGIYGRVAITGEPVIFESFSEPLNEWYQVSAYSPINNHFAVVFQNITEHKYNSKLIEILKEISENFILCNIGGFDEIINASLQKIGEFIPGIDRCYLFKFYDNNLKIKKTHEWRARGIEYQIDQLKSFNAEDFYNWITPLLNNNFINIRSVSELPDNVIYKKDLIRHGIKSVIAIPLIDKNENPIGFLVFDSLIKERGWPGHNITGLEMFSKIIQNALIDESRQKTLQESEQHYRTLFNDSTDSIFIHSLDDLIFLEVNDSAVNIFGYSREELLSMRPMDLNEGTSKERIILAYRDMLKKGIRVFKRDTVHITKDGRHIPVELTTSIIKYKGKDAFLAIAHDITKRREGELAKLSQHKTKNMEMFLANMSHDIRTPMNSIVIYLQLLLEDPSLTKSQRGIILDIDFSVKSLVSLVDDILELTRMSSGSQSMSLAPCNLIENLDRLNTMMSVFGAEKDISFKMQLDHRLRNLNELLFICDWPRLNRVLINLITNGIKFTSGKKGCVTFEVQVKNISETKCTIFFKVSDTGIGIANDRLEKIFDQFSNPDLTIRNKYGGSGLGLSVANKLVELMSNNQNKVLVESEGQDKGASFYFELNFDLINKQYSDDTINDLTEVDTQTEEQLSMASEMYVLAVDDNMINCRVVKKFLQSLGFIHIDVKENGKKAFEQFIKEPIYDFILMDCEMPVMDGFVASECILNYCKKQNISSPVIIALTAHALESNKIRCMEAGMQGYLNKPLRREDFKKELSSFFNILYNDTQRKRKQIKFPHLMPSLSKESLTAENQAGREIEDNIKNSKISVSA